MTIVSKIARVLCADAEVVERHYSESEKVEQYIERKLGSRDLWALTPDKQRAMYAIVKTLKPSLAVETGVGPGSSTTVILSAIGRGRLHSIDYGIKYGNEKETYPVGFLIPERLKGKWKLHIGDSAELLEPLLDSLGRIDMFYHDSTHEEKHVRFEITNAWEHIVRGVILIDNYQWTSAPEKLSRKVGAGLTELSGKAGGFCIIPKNLAGVA